MSPLGAAVKRALAHGHRPPLQLRHGAVSFPTHLFVHSHARTGPRDHRPRQILTADFQLLKVFFTGIAAPFAKVMNDLCQVYKTFTARINECQQTLAMAS